MNREEYFFDFSKLPKGEKEYCDKIRPIIEGLLDDLRKEKSLRIPTRQEIERFVSILKDKDEMSLSLNMIYRIFTGKSLDDFLEKTKDYFTDSSLSYLLISQLYLHFLISIEMFRVVLLFYLKRGKKEIFNDKLTLQPFLCQLKKVSPEHTEQIEEELDIKLRNSLAHGMYKIDGANFVYYEHVGKLENPEIVPLDKLFTKMKFHHLVYHSLIQAIAERLREGTLL